MACRSEEGKQAGKAVVGTVREVGGGRWEGFGFSEGGQEAFE